MEFGKVGNLRDIDFSLPPDDPLTAELLAGLGRASGKEEGAGSARGQAVKLYVGCAKWGRKDWLGKVYPKGTKEKDFLAHYTRQFNCIELNALFYNLQPHEVIERWAALASPDFRFCPKFSETISHTLQLKNAGAATDLFLEHMLHFGEKLGPCFLQLSDRFGTDRGADLEEYLRSLPRDFRVCLELRHPDWFTGEGGMGKGSVRKIHAGECWRLMRELGVGSVITDTSGRRDCLHMRLTAPFAFIRFVGNNLHPTDFGRIDAWADRIKTWIEQGLREIYFFIHNHEEVNSPEMCKYAIGQFNQKCGTRLKPPNLLNGDNQGNLSLF